MPSPSFESPRDQQFEELLKITPPEACSPQLAYSIVSLRDLFNSISDADQTAIVNLLEDDPWLEKACAQVRKGQNDVGENSPELASAVSQLLKEGVSADSHSQLTTLVEFYFGYRRPFPNLDEVDPLKNLMEYIRTSPGWDAIMAQGLDGRILGGCCGQIVKVHFPSGTVNVAWNEHTYVDKEFRRNGIGNALDAAFTERALKNNSIGIVIEFDNGYLLTNDPKAFDNDTTIRGSYWTDILGEEMDPFARTPFWDANGYRLLVVGNPPTPADWITIRMNPETGPCDGLSAAFKPLNQKYKDGLSLAEHLAVCQAFNETIDENATLYPEFVRTRENIALQGDDSDPVRLLSLKDPAINEILSRARVAKENAARRDLNYCDLRLQNPEISDSEREILEISRKYAEALIQGNPEA